MPRFSDEERFALDRYDDACQSSNAAYFLARQAGFDDESLKVLAAYVSAERKLYASFIAGTRQLADRIRAKYVPEPLKAQYVGQPVPAMKQGRLPL